MSVIYDYGNNQGEDTVQVSNCTLTYVQLYRQTLSLNTEVWRLVEVRIDSWVATASQVSL